MKREPLAIEIPESLRYHQISLIPVLPQFTSDSQAEHAVNSVGAHDRRPDSDCVGAPARDSRGQRRRPQVTATPRASRHNAELRAGPIPFAGTILHSLSSSLPMRGLRAHSRRSFERASHHLALSLPARPTIGCPRRRVSPDPQLSLPALTSTLPISSPRPPSSPPPTKSNPHTADPTNHKENIKDEEHFGRVQWRRR
ncbi:uncharacterized protein A4U43_C01F20640 [Asparagus officinalis]|uniref:Uncharacterized protein n=1 Tax=Asparagus officinalis TaxID=4686 RepID=A0A5P1FUJ9_ASPOF|nr:uncharacterized protein A4U43_C01F20640 [Asparagus officinalis]